MSERTQLAGAVKRIAWGYVLMHVNFNLGTLDILPDWVGYLMILSVLPLVAAAEASAKLLKPFGIILTVWEVLIWVMNLLGAGDWDQGWMSMVATVISLYFHFQLLTNLAAISEKYGCPETNRILTLRTVQTLLTTVLALPLPWEDYEPLAIILLIVSLVVVIWLCAVLFSLRRSLEAWETRDVQE